MTHSRDSLIETLCRYMASHNEWRSKHHVCEEVKWTYREGGMTKTYLVDGVSRKMRELESECRVAVRPDRNGKSIEYKFIPVEHRSMYIPYSSRPDDKKNILFKI